MLYSVIIIILCYPFTSYFLLLDLLVNHMENEMKMMERSDTSPVRDAHSSALEASLNSDVHRRTCVFLACEASDSISGGS